MAPGARVLVLSHDLWSRRFGGSPNALGQVLDLGDKEYRVIGVMPRGFHFPSAKTQAWAPAPSSGWWTQYAARRGRRGVVVFGRLMPQSALEQAQAEMSAVASRLESR